MIVPQLSPEMIREAVESRQIHPEMVVGFDLIASQKALELWSSTSEGSKEGRPSLRVYIEGKGCDGFYYGVAFDRSTPEDFVFCGPSVDVIVDPQSLGFVYGSQITWIQGDAGEGFLVQNPNHERFRGKFFKKKAWQASLTAPAGRQ
jgi:iron-sulfur cluster insertion protein